MPVIAIREDALPDHAVLTEALGRLAPSAPVCLMGADPGHFSTHCSRIMTGPVHDMDAPK